MTARPIGILAAGISTRLFAHFTITSPVLFCPSGLGRTSNQLHNYGPGTGSRKLKHVIPCPHSPMLQRSEPNSWKRKTLSPCTACTLCALDQHAGSSSQLLPVSTNFRQPLKINGTKCSNQQLDGVYGSVSRNVFLKYSNMLQLKVPVSRDVNEALCHV